MIASRRASTATGSTSFGPRSELVDCWRGAACLLVVIFHGLCGFFVSAVHPVMQFAALHAKYGWVGRNMLFVLSGYCLAQLMEKRGPALSPLAFWRDRLLRIYLTYWAAFLLALVLALAATPFNGLSPAEAVPKSATAWLGDLTLSHIWLGIRPWMIVSWSLAFEIGFYLVLGIVLLAGYRGPMFRLGYCAAVTFICHLPAVSTHVPALGLWPIFACGLAVQAALSEKLPLQIRGAAMSYPALLAVLGFSRDDHQTLAPALLSMVFLLTVASSHRLPRSPRFLVRLGRASYSIFLVHVTVMSPALNLAKRHLAQDEAPFVCVWIAHIFLGIAAGLLFHRWVESPLESWRRRTFASPPVHAPSASAAAR